MLTFFHQESFLNICYEKIVTFYFSKKSKTEVFIEDMGVKKHASMLPIFQF